PALHATLRLAAALTLGATLLACLAILPESALQGMNLGYKRMELQAALNVVGGAFTAGAVYAGLGLVGVAGAQIAIAGVSGLCFWVLGNTSTGARSWCDASSWRSPGCSPPPSAPPSSCGTARSWPCGSAPTTMRAATSTC